MDDDDQFVRLLISKRSVIIAYARSIVFDRDLAEDIYQNVVLVAMRKRSQIDRTDDPLPWLLGVTRLESLDALRKRKKHQAVFDDQLLDLLESTWIKSIQEREQSDATPYEAIGHCLRKLTDRGRTIIKLRYVEGLKGEELANRLDAKLNTIYVALSRIHKQLRECIQNYQNRQQT